MNIMVIAAVGAVLYLGADGAWHGVKKIGHKVECMLIHGRSCIASPGKITIRYVDVSSVDPDRK